MRTVAIDNDRRIRRLLSASAALVVLLGFATGALAAKAGDSQEDFALALTEPETFQIHAKGVDIRDVLRMLSEESRRNIVATKDITCLLYTSPSPRDRQRSRMPSSA